MTEELEREQAAEGRGHRLTLRTLLKVLAATCVTLALSTSIFAYQVTQRNSKLDELDDQSDRIEASVVEIQGSAGRIEAIAEDFAAGDPDQAAALQDIFRKIDAIYQATVPEEEQTP